MGAEALAAALVFISVGALTMVLLQSDSPRRAAEQRIRTLNKPHGDPALEGQGLLTRSVSPLPFLRKLTSTDNDWVGRTTLDLQRAGLSLRVSEYLLIRLLTAALIGIAVVLISNASPLGVVLAMLFGAGGFMVPAAVVRHLKGRRQSALNAQLVETLQMISNGLRSGFAFTQAIELAARQMAPPMSDELEYFLRDSRLGSAAEDSLKALVERTGSLDIEMMVTTILVQRTTGGNLSEILDNVAETIRERERLKGEIRALTASQRFTGLILSIYPAFLAVVFFAIAPSVMKVLITEATGRILLVVAVCLQLMGAWTIRRILTLDV
ncbi:MAG: secretion system protein [Chloroflexi bacterium]|nr:MAG: secretion system protein [Chloroflexota bacterium]